MEPSWPVFFRLADFLPLRLFGWGLRLPGLVVYFT